MTGLTTTFFLRWMFPGMAALTLVSPVCVCQDPGEFLRSQGLPRDLSERLVKSKRSTRDAIVTDDGKSMIGVAKQTFRNPRMSRSAKVAAALRAKQAILRLSWQRTFPKYRYPDVLVDLARRSKGGLSVKGLLLQPQSVSRTMGSAVYSVVQVRLEGVKLGDCFPPAKDVEAAYLAELRRKARTLESTDKPRSAMAFIKEHVRFSTLPRESLPLEGLCRLGVGQETEAKTIADTVWNSKLPGSSSFWFDLAELEYRLGREELSTRAVEKANTAWNNENWFGV